MHYIRCVLSAVLTLFYLLREFYSEDDQISQMDSSRTISELKTVFLRHQIRVLSATLEPSEDWRDYGPEFEDGLTDKAVADVAQKGN